MAASTRSRRKTHVSSSKRGTGDYEVGRGKPPKHSQYPKGVSGNPNGRPPGRLRPDPTLSEILDERVVGTGPDGRRRSMTKREIVLRKLVKKASDGDHRSIIAVNEYDRRRDMGEENPDAFEFDPELRVSLLEEYDQEVMQRGAKNKKPKRKTS